MSTPLKLRVDFANKTFDGEGDPELVERLFQEFSERIAKSRATSPSPSVDEADDDELEAADTIDEAVKIRRRRRTAKQGAEKISDYTPTRLNNLDLSKLDSFYSPWAPRSHAERILLFASFLEEVLALTPCTADHIYTCYLHTREKLPEAFLQAFRDAGGNKNGFIEYKSPSDISITIAGRNHLLQNKIRRKEAGAGRS